MDLVIRLRSLGLIALAPLLASACVVSGAANGSARASHPEPPARAHAGGSATVEARVEVEFFGVPLTGAQDVVFVLDRSGSMGSRTMGKLAGGATQAGRNAGMNKWESALVGVGTAVATETAGVEDRSAKMSKLEAAKRELLDAVAGLPDGTRIGILFFNDDIHALSRRLITLDRHTRGEIAAFIDAVEPSDSTAAVPAMQLAYEMGARRVVLLSDGLANTGGDGGDLLQDGRAAARRGVRIDTVGLGFLQDSDVLQAMARESGGIAVMR